VGVVIYPLTQSVLVQPRSMLVRLLSSPAPAQLLRPRDPPRQGPPADYGLTWRS
jgi:hypothetical protein